MALFSLRNKPTKSISQNTSWVFPSNNDGPINGINDSGVETFRGTPIKSLAREICQNSLDATYDTKKPTYVTFETFEIEPTAIPEFDSLKKAFSSAEEFWRVQETKNAQKFFENATRVSKQRAIRCLRISDYNTSGLTGSSGDYNTPWCNLTKSQGTSDKSGATGGSFGIGKFAPFACSDFRTVFYSTLDKERTEAYQGVSRLTSFKASNQEGDFITQGIGFYGLAHNKPVNKQISLQEGYCRHENEFGTDIFILAFNGDKKWKDDLIISVLDGFLYAIFNNELIVNVDNETISKDTLPSLMEKYKQEFASNRTEHADKYYSILTTDSENSKEFCKDFADGLGVVKLKLMISPEMHKRVAMVRKTGMKIMDKGNFSTGIPFAGVLYVEGDGMNEYLRTLENPQHTKWEVARAENKSEAQAIIKSLRTFIIESLDELKKEDSSESIDPSVGEYLALEDNEKETPEQPNETLTDTIVSVTTTVIQQKPSNSGLSVGGKEEAKVDDENGDITETGLPGTGSGQGESHGGRGNGGGNGEGNGGGHTPQEHHKKIVGISPLKVRSLCKNKLQGEYEIVFVPSTSAVDGYIELFQSAETQNYDAPIISAICNGQNDIEVLGNRISGLTFNEKETIRIAVTLDYHDICSMEVKAYGNPL